MILIFISISIIAAILVTSGKSLPANKLWVISNVGMIHYNYQICEYEMVILFSAYFIIAIYGIYNLSRKFQSLNDTFI